MDPRKNFRCDKCGLVENDTQRPHGSQSDCPKCRQMETDFICRFTRMPGRTDVPDNLLLIPPFAVYTDAAGKLWIQKSDLHGGSFDKDAFIKHIGDFFWGNY